MIMIYEGVEIDISKCDFVNGFATLPIGLGLSIPEEGATAEELVIIQAIKDNMKNRVIEVDIDTLKENKKNELWKACNDSILGGFIFTLNGNDYLIGFDEQDQSNLTQTAVLLDSISADIVWKVKGELSFITLTKTDFLNMLLTAKSFKEINMGKYFSLCGQLALADTQEEISAIVW